MAQRQIEDRVDGTEKEIMGLKEMLLEMKKAMERMAEDLRENHSYKRREESGTFDGSIMKLKGKAEETDIHNEGNLTMVDRSKYKKLEMPMFLGENPESWVYRAEHFFEINNLPETEKVKVAVVSFGQDEEDWSMDFIEGLPKAGGMNVIMVIVDRLSKYSYFITMRHPFNARQVAEVFIDRVVSRHGIPKSIISDRDKIFISNFWKEIFASMGTLLKRSTAFHPQTDGQTERVNRCVETYLRCFCNEQPTKWNKFIPWAELWYNTTFHASSRSNPFQIVYGRSPPPLLSYGNHKTPHNEVELMLKERDLALIALKENLNVAQNRMKKMADSKRRELKFKVGDEVYLKLRPYRQHSLARKRSEKLAPKFYGPYRIIEEIGEVAYRLQLPPEASIHDVFHISQLKLKLGKTHVVQIQQPVLTEEFELQLQPETVLGIRWNKDLGANEWLVKWKELPENEATWEAVYQMNQQFPTFHLEDKVNLEPRGIVRPPIIHTYRRKGRKVTAQGIIMEK